MIDRPNMKAFSKPIILSLLSTIYNQYDSGVKLNNSKYVFRYLIVGISFKFASLYLNNKNQNL